MTATIFSRRLLLLALMLSLPLGGCIAGGGDDDDTAAIPDDDDTTGTDDDDSASVMTMTRALAMTTPALATMTTLKLLPALPQARPSALLVAESRARASAASSASAPSILLLVPPRRAPTGLWSGTQAPLPASPPENYKRPAALLPPRPWSPSCTCSEASR